MGTTINGVYVPSANETGWDVAMNAGLTTLANAHITNRSFFLSPPEGLTSLSNPPTAIYTGSGANWIPIFTFANAITTTAFWTFQVPADATSTAIVVRPVWAAGTTDGTAHTVRWSMDVKNLSVGADALTAGTTTAFTGLSGSRTANIVVVETGASAGTFSPLNLLRLNLSRLGADALDTFANTANLIGVRIDYVAV